jgi:nucleoside phosphorylase
MYAIKEAPVPRPKGLIIKSVCDYADEEKSDQYQKFAAFTSAQFAKLLYEKFLK